jgi:cellulose synthase/poly-beta-1,6-N-acetylglucosamine synthase-like glycosyltransferase
VGGRESESPERVVVLVPAHNEATSIAETIRCALDQVRVPDLVVVIANNCTDETAAIAATFPEPVVVLDVTVPRSHGKSRALNLAWREYCQDADIVVCLDADTSLPPHAIGDWAAEFRATPALAGSSSKFTMRGGDVLTRLQRAEFARWTDTSLRRGWTSVLAGTGCAIRQDALRAVVRSDGREGPWSYESQVEDFELTYRIRELGWHCQVSPTVRAYTDSMKSLRALWGQRMKWQVGTVEDLLRFGVNRRTWLDWRQQAAGLAAAVCRVGWVGLTVLALALGVFTFHPVWLLLTVLFVANDVRQSLRIPHRDHLDVVLAALLLPQELFAWMRAAWFTAAWTEALVGRLTHRSRDRWALQYRAEGA